MSLEELRSQIDAVDRDLVALLNRRAELSREVGRLKRTQAGPDHEPEIYRPDREAAVLAKIQDANAGPLPHPALVAIYREILSSSRALQRPLRIAFLGPKATNTFEAARHHFGSSEEFIPYRSVADVFDETEKRTVDFGVVAVENSTEGTVRETADCFLESNLQVCAQIERPIGHFLLAKAELSEIKRVYSHPQALAQCRRWLAENLPHADTAAVASTAHAAQLASDPTAAAIATESAAELYGLPIRARRIEDAPNNVTRFFVIGPHRSLPTGRDQTAIVFAVHDRPGALHEALQAFATDGINLTRIESRPSRRKIWEYVFFADLTGHPDDSNVGNALKQLEQACTFIKILGAWPIG